MFGQQWYSSRLSLSKLVTSQPCRTEASEHSFLARVVALTFRSQFQDASADHFPGAASSSHSKPHSSQLLPTYRYLALARLFLIFGRSIAACHLHNSSSVYLSNSIKKLLRRTHHLPFKPLATLHRPLLPPSLFLRRPSYSDTARPTSQLSQAGSASAMLESSAHLLRCRIVNLSHQSTTSCT